MATKRRGETIKMATFASPSFLINQGGLQTLDSRQREIQNEIESFRERFFHLEARCRGLVANFQILKCLLKNERLKKRLVREGKANIGLRLTMVLFDACILDCCALLEDKDPVNPSLRVLVHPFLRGNREKNREFLERLANFHLRRAISERQRAAGRRRFNQAVERLTLDWGILTKADQKLTIVRRKLIAHHELEHDPVGKSFSEIKLPNIGEIYDQLEKAIAVISQSVTRLAFLLMDADITLKSFERVIKDDVAKFWDLRPATRRK
jgi:AbiU2